MWPFKKKTDSNKIALKSFTGRQLQYVSKRVETEDGERDMIVGKGGRVAVHDGEIKIIDVNGKLDWECPQCGNRDHDTLNIIRRTCGYLGSNFWNQGRTNEIKDRVVHLDDKML